MIVNGIASPAFPHDSLITVSGSSGFIGSHVCDQALAAGYRVRDTTRRISKSGWIVEHFERKYSQGSFELAEVPLMEAEGPFDHVVTGTSLPSPQ